MAIYFNLKQLHLKQSPSFNDPISHIQTRMVDSFYIVEHSCRTSPLWQKSQPNLVLLLLTSHPFHERKTGSISTQFVPNIDFPLWIFFLLLSKVSLSLTHQLLAYAFCSLYHRELSGNGDGNVATSHMAQCPVYYPLTNSYGVHSGICGIWPYEIIQDQMRARVGWDQ